MNGKPIGKNKVIRIQFVRALNVNCKCVSSPFLMIILIFVVVVLRVCAFSIRC